MEISFKDIIRIIKKNLIFIIITSLIFAACSYFAMTFFVQKTYTSSVKLYVETKYSSAQNNAADSLSGVNYAQKLVATYIEILDTYNFYSAVSDSLNNKYSSSELSEMITFSSIEDTEVFKARVVSSSPTEAKKIADAVSVVAPQTIHAINENANLKIVEAAIIPTQPTSPRITRNTFIAFVFGLFVSLIIAFVRDYLDINVKYNEELTELCGVPVLAAVPDFESFAGGSRKRKNKKKSGVYGDEPRIAK